MKSGIYKNISNEAYHASAGISRSGVMAFRMSPLHYWHDYINPAREAREPTLSMLMGEALHTDLLEPELFSKKFLIIPSIDKRTTAGKEFFNKINSEKGIKKLIKMEDYNVISEMRNSILSHPEAKDLIKGANYETSIYWNDLETEILCKARPDIIHENMIIDLKTTDNASPQAFKYSILNYGYHVQAAMLIDGQNYINNLSENKINQNNFIIIAVEKKPPYAVAVYILDPATIEKGREIYKSTLIEYKKCLEENRWSSYPTQIISI